MIYSFQSFQNRLKFEIEFLRNVKEYETRIQSFMDKKGFSSEGLRSQIIEAFTDFIEYEFRGFTVGKKVSSQDYLNFWNKFIQLDLFSELSE